MIVFWTLSGRSASSRREAKGPWSPLASTTGGARAPLSWPWTCRSPGPWSWWLIKPGRLRCPVLWTLRGLGQPRPCTRGVWPGRPGGPPWSEAPRPLVQPMCKHVQRVLKSSYRAWIGGWPLPSNQWPWAGRDAQPQTQRAEAVSCSPFPYRCLPKWVRMKRKHVGGQSRGRVTSWWVLRELPGRMMKLAGEGPDGVPAGTSHPGGCGWAPTAETTPGPACPQLLTGRGKGWRPCLA